MRVADGNITSTQRPRVVDRPGLALCHMTGRFVLNGCFSYRLSRLAHINQRSPIVLAGYLKSANALTTLACQIAAQNSEQWLACLQESRS